MATSKKEFSATDAAPVVLYGLKTASSEIAFPIVATSSGALFIAGISRENKKVQKTTLTTTAATTVITSVGSTFLDVYGFICANTSATATVVRLKDNGTEKSAIAVPAGETRGFMIPVDSAIPADASGTQWTASLDTAVTSVEITALFTKNT